MAIEHTSREVLTYVEAALMLGLTVPQVTSAVLRHELEMAASNEENATCITRASIEAYQLTHQSDLDEQEKRATRTVTHRESSGKPRATRKSKKGKPRTVTLPAQVRLAIIHLDLLTELGLSHEQVTAFFSHLEGASILRGGESYSMTRIHLERGEKGAYFVVATLDTTKEEGHDAS